MMWVSAGLPVEVKVQDGQWFEALDLPVDDPLD